jgi:hypothetical protein
LSTTPPLPAKSHILQDAPLYLIHIKHYLRTLRDE